MTNKPLFRLAAVKQQTSRLDGAVIIAQPLSSSVLTLCLILSVGAILSFLTVTDFHRKETVTGYLKPDIGLAKVHASRSGIVSELYIEDGNIVQAGQPLLKLTIPDYLAEGNSLVDSLNISLQQQQSLLSQRRDQLAKQFEQQQQELTDRIAYHQTLLNELQQQNTLLQQRWQLQQQRFAKLSQLKAQGGISKVDWQLQQENVLQLEQQIAEQNAGQQSQFATLAQLSGQLARLPSEHEQQLAMLDTESARLAQQQLELQARHQLLITAPVSGRVTNLIAEPGSNILHSQPLLTILPTNAQLQAILLVPTRAFGFVTPGQRTRLRFDAFPYQRFGLYEGEVLKTGQAIILPNEVEMPIAIQEPVYRVAVALNAQEIRAYGTTVPLQSGMLLSADIVLEQRSLISWLFEPILSLQGRL